MAEYNEDVKRLVKERLFAMPPDVSFSIGEYGDYSPKDLVREVEKDSEIGREVIEMQLGYIRKMPTLLSK